MSFALLPLLVGQTSPLGPIPHLAKGELLFVTEGGGQLGYRGRLIVREDGTVIYTSARRDRSETTKRWKLSKGERNSLRLLIAEVDFDALHRAKPAAYPPSAADGLDRSLAVRQGKAVRGWSNTLWTSPETPVPLFEHLQGIIDRSRPTAG